VNLTIDDEPLSAEAIRGLEEGLDDIKKGNLISEENIRKKYGVK
jgi:hypothetical protein